ncbi:MAG: hypothetical protein CVU41_18985 [Chloroflexi bacterium HGW-Chloroflexi-3]|nr:MAG: hypothetical protein CVU41_18985 [Chloroflexi bacterium HGW-Chloroflexi-3]
MSTRTLYVIDTTVLISFFNTIFGCEKKISSFAEKLIDSALNYTDSTIRISIPSIVFVELFDKFIKNEEFSKKIFFEIFIPIINSPNIEIKPIDKDVLLGLSLISGELEHHDLHDKLILASAK